MGRELTDIAPLSRRRNVSYLTSKKANITRADKSRKPHRAIKNIKHEENLEQSVDTQKKDISKKIKRILA